MTETGKPVTISGYLYTVKPDHRDGTLVKSQWTISIKDECACFKFGIDSNWKLDQRAWGLHLVNGAADYLGHTALDNGPKTDLCVAFFQLKDTAHGYPSDPKRSIKKCLPMQSGVIG